MKKKQCIFFALILIIVVSAVVIILNIPDNQQTSFVVDGNNWSGEVLNGGSLLLELNNDDNRKEWSITLKPEIFVSDYHNIAGTISEFHIIALNDGKGEMVFQCTNDDGRTDKYILELSISRDQKNISKLIPFPSKRANDNSNFRGGFMWFWWFILVCDLLVPFTMLIAGRMMWKHCPKHINGVVGYRTRRSMKNIETWKFAHDYCGQLWWKIGLWMIIPSVLVHVPFYHSDEDAIGNVSLILVIIQCIVLVLSILPTEHALKKK